MGTILVDTTIILCCYGSASMRNTLTPTSGCFLYGKINLVLI
nr:MAG TPA: hypothetical protein [Caudoviricetes sp.]